MPSKFLRIVMADLWWREPHKAWLEEGTVPADCVSDLLTKKNKLSVYETDGEDDAVQTAAALSLQRAGSQPGRTLPDVGALIFDQDILDRLKIAVEKKDGTTRDKRVNGRHWDLVELSGHKLAEFAKELLLTTQPRTFYKPEMVKQLRESIKTGEIAGATLPEWVQHQLKE